MVLGRIVNFGLKLILSFSVYVFIDIGISLIFLEQNSITNTSLIKILLSGCLNEPDFKIELRTSKIITGYNSNTKKNFSPMRNPKLLCLVVLLLFLIY